MKGLLVEVANGTWKERSEFVRLKGSGTDYWSEYTKKPMVMMLYSRK